MSETSIPAQPGGQVGAPGGNIVFASGRGQPADGEQVTFPGGDGDIIFQTGDNEVMRFRGDGTVLVRGNEVAFDRELYLVFREWLASARYKHENGTFRTQGR